MHRAWILAFIGLSAVAHASEIPSRPRYPVRMDTMPAGEFCDLFFAEIDLAEPSMSEVRRSLAEAHPMQALQAWQRAFITRVGSLPTPRWTPHNTGIPLAPIMTPGRVVMIHGDSRKDYGPPGSMDWHGLQGWSLHRNMMWHPKTIIMALEAYQDAGPPKDDETRHLWEGVARGLRNGTRYPPVELLSRWRDIWRDYANNNWRVGMPLANDAALRAKALQEAGLAGAPDPEWGNQISYRQQLVLSWPVMNFIEQLTHAVTVEPELFRTVVSPRDLAEMLYFTVVWPVSNLVGDSTDAADLVGGAPNQFHEKASQMLRIGLLAPEFKRNQRVLRLADEMIRIIVGMPGHVTRNTDQSPDGSGSEFSYNYMKSLVTLGSEWATIAASLTPRPDWEPWVRKAVDHRKRFMGNLSTPLGMQPIAKANIEQRTSPLEPPAGNAAAYTSIAFPWHVLYQMRDGWDPRSLYLSLMSPRRGQGHASENGNALMMEAYGLRMLVYNAGESGHAFGSSRAQNSIVVDGLTQQQLCLPARGAYPQPGAGRWHASARYDVAETVFTDGYGPDAFGNPGHRTITLTSVVHRRQVLFARRAKLWFVVDTLATVKPDEAHAYDQIWHLNSAYAAEDIVTDAAGLRIGTRSATMPNLSLHQVAMHPLSYASHRGEGGEGIDDFERLPESARGWHNTGGGYGGKGSMKQVRPATDLYVSWTGTGRQWLLTAIVPQPGKNDPLADIARHADQDQVALTLTLKDGTVLTCTAGPDLKPTDPLSTGRVCTTLVERQTDGGVSGLELGPFGETGVSYDVVDGRKRSMGRIDAPTAFRWVSDPVGDRPCYQPMP